MNKELKKLDGDYLEFLYQNKYYELGNLEGIKEDFYRQVFDFEKAKEEFAIAKGIDNTELYLDYGEDDVWEFVSDDIDKWLDDIDQDGLYRNDYKYGDGEQNTYVNQQLYTHNGNYKPENEFVRVYGKYKDKSQWWLRKDKILELKKENKWEDFKQKLTIFIENINQRKEEIETFKDEEYFLEFDEY